MVTRRVQSLLVRDEDASDDWFLGLKARHWICVAGKKEGAWDGRKTCVQHWVDGKISGDLMANGLD